MRLQPVHHSAPIHIGRFVNQLVQLGWPTSRDTLHGQSSPIAPLFCLLLLLLLLLLHLRLLWLLDPIVVVVVVDGYMCFVCVLVLTIVCQHTHFAK